jgi:hypothetical protein
VRVHRLIFIERVSDRRQLAAIEDTVPIDAATYGLPSVDDAEASLQGGETFKFDETLAGVRIHGRLTPAHAINRQGMDRRKLEGKQ